MACISKLATAIAYDCDSGATGLVSALIINKADIASFSVDVADYNTVKTLVLASGARSYKVEGYKQNIQYTTSLKTTEASARLNTSVSFKIKSDGLVMQALSTGKFYVMTLDADGTSDFIGANAPLECSAMDFDSNANARLVTVTLSDPEGSAGNHFHVCYSAVRDSIISKSV